MNNKKLGFFIGASILVHLAMVLIFAPLIPSKLSVNPPTGTQVRLVNRQSIEQTASDKTKNSKPISQRSRRKTLTDTVTVTKTEKNLQPKQAQVDSNSAQAIKRYDAKTLGLRARYPHLSQIQGEQGSVLLAIEKNAEGTRQILLRRSSGFTRLDTSAESALTTALAENKIPDLDKMEVNFSFKLY